MEELENAGPERNDHQQAQLTAAAGDRGSRISSFLDEVDRVGISYVSWKNNHELKAYLDGGGDIDLFVAPDRRVAFTCLALREGWVELENPVAIYPRVAHFFAFGRGDRIYHLHVYFGVVTGESWLKEYVLPLDSFLLGNRERGLGGVWVLTQSAQRYLFALRHLLKGGSVSSRWLYRRELRSYKKEWVACRGPEVWDPDLGPWPLSSYADHARLSEKGFGVPELLAAIRFRASLAPFLRVPGWSLPVRRLAAFVKRAANKVFFRQKKIFPNGGLVIAISGVDGAGKSTMLNAMSAFFSRVVTVRMYSLGRPQGPVLETLRKIFSKRRRGRSDGTPSVSVRSAPGVLQAFAWAVLAWRRLRVARRAFGAARRGYMVLVDRWPTAELGKMDGPRIGTGFSRKHRVVDLLGRFEMWAYSRMPRADVCLFRTVSMESALQRNRERVKQGKESDADIRRRFENNQNVSPLASKVIVFRNDGEFFSMREQLIEMIWAEAAGR